MNMQRQWLGRQWQHLLLGSGLMLGLAVGQPLARSIQLSDGTVYFVRPPQLVNAVVYHKGSGSLFATYYFTLNLPADAGEPLRRVTLAQSEGVDPIRFIPEDTYAYIGKNRRDRLPLGDVIQDRQSRTTTVIFEPPVAPGTTLTLAMRPVQNPRFGGVYLFGVTAFPPGEKTHGQFLGYGRLQFYEDDFFQRPFF